eukprot:scaffold3775_cov101-Isochrysis_galbana.AAC.1
MRLCWARRRLTSRETPTYAGVESGRPGSWWAGASIQYTYHMDCQLARRALPLATEKKSRPTTFRNFPGTFSSPPAPQPLAGCAGLGGARWAGRGP